MCRLASRSRRRAGRRLETAEDLERSQALGFAGGVALRRGLLRALVGEDGDDAPRAARERDALVASSAAVLAEVQAHKKDACEALRREVAALTAALRSAQQAAARADERAARATAAKAKAVDDWRASEAKVAELRARLSRRSNVLHAPSQRPRPLPTAAWH